MYKIGVIGDADSVCGFQAVGISVFTVDNAVDATRLLRKIAEQYAVIFITEKLACQMEGELALYREKTVPAVIPIPGVTGNTGFGLKNISRSVEQAVGSDILPD